ncbi:MAG: hypothetical protein PVG61_07360 [Dehalococcoidia bacterium]
MADVGKFVATADNRADSAQGYPDKSQEKLGKEHPGDDSPAGDPSIGNVIGEMVGDLLRQCAEESDCQYRRKNQQTQRQDDVRPPERFTPAFFGYPG